MEVASVECNPMLKREVTGSGLEIGEEKSSKSGESGGQKIKK